MRRLWLFAFGAALGASLTPNTVVAQSLQRARASLVVTVPFDTAGMSGAVSANTLRSAGTRRPFLRNTLIGIIVGGLLVAQLSGGITDAFCDADAEVCRGNVREARVVGGISGGLAGAAIGALIACARSPGSANAPASKESSEYVSRTLSER